MSAEAFSYTTAGIQSIVTSIAVIVGGLWALRLFGVAREGHPHIQFSADINFIAFQDGFWIVELVALIENKGRARHNIETFAFDVYSLDEGDRVTLAKEFGNQVFFPNLVAKGNWLSRDYDYYFIEPGVAAKYSYIARIPSTARVLLFHTWFSYPDKKNGHTAERTVRCPELPFRPEALDARA